MPFFLTSTSYRAKKEVNQLDVEIHCLTTYIQDEDLFLCMKIEEYSTVHPPTAFQIDKHCHSRACFNNQHIWCLIHLARDLHKKEEGWSDMLQDDDIGPGDDEDDEELRWQMMAMA
ncbi:hypothetical protein ARMGADRAFT_1036634 [Armillaria gallica]|uniref:Uncharacterized protein n=1 Tax=Armillaria gallica TaxID=47427 RepID=A0A2H3CQ20_ARMGA|nr:hypothetical protein ARMGADRAFT_1036634 [Armillaria gallica]